MRKIIFASILMLVSGILFSGCRSVEPKSAAPPEVLAEFDFQGEMNYIILPVTFQGQEYPFALDTGATDTLFDISFKDKFGKRFLWPKKGDAAHGKKVKVELFHAPDAYLGSLNLNNSPYKAISDLDQLIPKKNRKFQGLIGMDFLQQYIVQIDFDNKKVIFFNAKKDGGLFSSFRPKENKHPEWGEPIPLKTKLFNRLRFIKGKLLDNISAEFMIDSGWQSHGTLESELYKKVNPKLSFDAIYNDSTNTVKSDIGLKMIEKFSVGQFEYNNNIFQKSNMSILGLQFLSRHLVTFDFLNNVMYLKKGKNFDKPVNINIFIGNTGCILITPGYIVTQVDPNGTAYKKGIREKDVLIEINDHDISSLNPVEFMELQSQLLVPKEGGYTFTFKRGNDIINTSFSEKDMLIENSENDQ
jgi:hypothetical protein